MRPSRDLNIRQCLTDPGCQNDLADVIRCLLGENGKQYPGLEELFQAVIVTSRRLKCELKAGT